MSNTAEHSLAVHLLKLVHSQPSGLRLSQLQAQLGRPVAKRTVQRQLAALVRDGRLQTLGTGRSTTYTLAQPSAPVAAIGLAADRPDYAAVLPLCAEALDIAAQVRRPLALRAPVSYQIELLEAYRPGHTWYLPEPLRRSLALLGRGAHSADVAGTFAKEIMSRLLIDLSWASSKLEGNTYTRLDTERLIAYGEAAQGHDAVEAQMILNHKAAIEYLVDRAAGLDLGPTTLLELHALLSDGLLPDPAASGRLRRRAVGIGGSVYLPMALPQRLEQVFGVVCATANAIADPFEQALFVMIHIPYLQPFEDVNKRVSRLAANVPLVRQNLVPLAFLDLPEQAYTDAILGIYELGRIELMRDVFVWAYERSCQHYAAVERQLVPPEPVRLKYRRQLGELVRAVVGSGVPADEQQVQRWVPDSVGEVDRQRFVQVAMVELEALHEGNAVRFGLSGLAVAGWRGGRQGSD
jgi:Fic family protein